ncbi:MAG: sugar phosphate isomerase/epimerase [Clostridia bacterium]|nr:sugar phosphate isomerase/epimerase [Clostridia bacterium]
MFDMLDTGLNLYSVRNLIQSEDGLLKTTLALKDMGYRYLQYSGAPFDHAAIKRVSEKTGVPFVLTHVPMDRIVGDTEKLMEEHAAFGCRNIGLGAMPAKIIADEAALKETVEKLERAGETMAKNGFKFFYHNHHMEFFRHGGETVLDYIIRTAPHINFTLDTYWVQYGGGDLYDVIEKLDGRIGCVHLKDYKIVRTGDNSFAPQFAPVGDGNIDFIKVVALMKKKGTEYFFVEQDNAAETDDPLGQVGRSAEYIKKTF